MTGLPQSERTLVQRIRRFFLRFVLLFLIPFIALFAATYFYVKGGRYVSTENAYVKSHIIAISADVAGRAVEVNVADNQRVAAGDLLFRIDPQPFALRVAAAEAEMTLALSGIELLRADYRESQIAIAEEKDNVRFMTTRLDRQEQLRTSGAGSADAYDEAQHNLRSARQRVAVLEERARRALATMGGDSQSDATLHPSYILAKARRDQASVELASTSVYAPSAGIVSNMNLQIGEYVDTGTPVFSLLDDDRVWVEANLKETQLTHLRPGQSATLTVDAYPQRQWAATVSAIAPATGAEFALLPPQNATGNWVKVVQRIPVELAVESLPNSPALRAGMTVTAKIDTNRQRGLPPSLRNLADSRFIPASLQTLLQRSMATDKPDVMLASHRTDGDRSIPPIVASRLPDPLVTAALPADVATSDLSTGKSSTKPTALTPTEGSDKTITLSRPATNDRAIESKVSSVKPEQWLAWQNPELFTIQLSVSPDLEFLHRFATQLSGSQPKVIYRYRLTDDQRQEYAMASGLFESRSSAKQASSKLAAQVRRYGPWVRQVGDIQHALGVK